jgi:hypothetical protein
MTPHVISLSPVLSTPYLATAAMDQSLGLHAASLRQPALPLGSSSDLVNTTLCRGFSIGLFAACAVPSDNG